MTHISQLILAACILKLTPLLEAAAVLDAEWEESEHPRKANGQFGYGGITSSHASGGTSGALNDKNDPDNKRREAHADLYYETRRRNGMNIFIKKIHANTGYSVKRLEQIYQHVFIRSHELDDGVHPFYSDYDMAQSFDRLLSGKNIQNHDLIMLKHEHLELSIMAKLGYNYSKAHTLTNIKYNYVKALVEWKNNGKNSTS
jgi:hypothetical protein